MQNLEQCFKSFLMQMSLDFDCYKAFLHRVLSVNPQPLMLRSSIEVAGLTPVMTMP